MSSRTSTWAFPALLLGSTLLAIGPWLVRLTGVGPVASGFWRLALALPFLFILAKATRHPVRWPGAATAGLVALAGLFFATDLASWHAGIHMTKLGNATLFGNVSSFGFALWGLWQAKRWPAPVQGLALLIAAAGVAMLMGSSAELSLRHVHGDLLALLAGALYTLYLIVVQRVRASMAPFPLLFLASLFGAAVLLPLAWAMGETLIPRNWTVVVLLALSSQVVGQGLLVYALGKLQPLVIGLTLLTQPAVAALVGWLAYGEGFSTLDWIGSAMVAMALIMVRWPGRDLRSGTAATS